MRTVLVTLLLVVWGLSVALSQTNVSGTISRDSTWTRTGSPYIVTGNVTLSSGFTLTVDSGVVVRFQANQGLYIRGNLVARHATFTSWKDTTGGSPARGDWYFIQIGDGSYTGTATLDTCRVKWGGYVSTGDYSSVYVYRGSAAIRGCDISGSKNSGVGVETLGSLTILNSNIFQCDWPIGWFDQGALTFSGTNNFTGNTHNGVNVRFSTGTGTMYLDTVSVPYVFPDFTVNGAMEIASGNMLKFTQYNGLAINGTLVAKASLGQQIRFTAYNDDNVGGDTNGDGTSTAPSQSYWNGISFNNLSVDTACILKRCGVTFAGYYQKGGISLYNASPTIDSCSMANNYYGVMMQGVSNPVFSNNDIGSSQVVPIAMSFAANPVFLNNSFSFSDNQYDAIGLLGGDLAANSNLPIRSMTTIPNVTYLMLEDVTVPQGVTLTIQKGIVIKSRIDVYYIHPRIIVQGKLVAVGTPDSLITFTSARDDNYGNPGDTNKDGTQSNPAVGDWGGIVFEATSDSNSIISYCRLKYGSLPWTYYNTRYIDGGEITTVNASPTITNCEIKDVNYGVYAFQASNPKIWNNAFINTQYTPVAMSVSANPSFIGNTFTNTKWTALGLIGEELGLSGTIKQRTIAGISNITYLLLEDLTINSGTNVTVDPGVVIKSNQAGIFVNGGFRAKGTIAGGQIIFTSIKDDNVGRPQDTNGDGNGTSPQRGDWKAIRFQATSDDAFCLLDSCVVKFGGSDYDVSLGAVTFVDASGTVSNTLISDSYNYGVRCDGGSNPLVIGVELKNCRLDPLAMSLKSNPTWTNITFTSNGTKGIRILEGTLSSNATLSKRDVAGITNIAYIVEQLTISSNAVLTIDPGVVIKFPRMHTYYAYASIVVNGALIADGTATQKIIFTSLKDDSNGGDTNNDGNNSTPTRGDWWSIEFRSSGSDSLNSLKNCEIRYGGSGYSYQVIKEQGAVRVFDAQVRIDSCVVQQSGTAGLGIYGSASPIVSNVQIYNILYTPVTMSLFANPTFTNISALNVGIMALGIVPETYSVSATVPKRDFAGYTNISYYFFTPWYLEERPTINSGTTITIPSGAVFKSDEGFRGILVNGALVVQGTSSQKVVFTDVRDDSYGNPGDTNGDGSSTSSGFSRNNRGWVEMSDVSDDSTSSIKYAVFRYREYGIDLLQASPRINNCIFDKTDWGVRLNGVSQPTLDSCSFNNLTYAPIRTSLVSYPRSSNGNVMSGSTYRAIGILEETLVQDVTLPRRSFGGVNNIPYVFSDYTIGTSAVLTISPGVVMKFFPGKRMIVRKGLIAEGGAHPDSTIVFTDIRDDFYGGDTNADSSRSTFDPSFYPSNWLGISFEDESLDPLCRLRHCVVRYAGYYYDAQYGGIATNNSSPTITYSLVSRNRSGVIASGASNPVINYCDIYDNKEFGIENVNNSFTIDARWNWWGNNTGPTHSSNVGGTGSTITDSVKYTPYLGSGAERPLAGDVSLNGMIQAYDASLVLKWLADAVVNPLNSIQQQVADVSGNGSILAYDASLILQYVVGKISIFPIEFNRSIEGGGILANAVSVGSIGITNGEVARGKQVTVTLTAEGLENVYAAGIELSYDQEALVPLTVQTTGIAAGKLFEYSAGEGRLRIFFASTDALTGGGGLVAITFEALDGVRGKIQSPVSFSQLFLNETSFLAQAKGGVIGIHGRPVSYSLNQNYPNPFNPQTTISYTVPNDGEHVRVEIYNLNGQLVRVLVDQQQPAGEYKVMWDGTTGRGERVGSGLYLYRMKAGTYVSVKKMIMVK